MPFLMACQFFPPSVVFQGRCHVPAYTMSGLPGSIASDSISWISRLPLGLICSHVAPLLELRKTPSSVPAKKVDGIERA